MDLGLTAVDASGRAEGGWQDRTADDGTTAGALGAMLRNWRPLIWEWGRASLCVCDFRGLERCSWVFMSATLSLKILPGMSSGSIRGLLVNLGHAPH